MQENMVAQEKNPSKNLKAFDYFCSYIFFLREKSTWSSSNKRFPSNGYHAIS